MVHAPVDYKANHENNDKREHEISSALCDYWLTFIYLTSLANAKYPIINAIYTKHIFFDIQNTGS